MATSRQNPTEGMYSTRSANTKPTVRNRWLAGRNAITAKDTHSATSRARTAASLSHAELFSGGALGTTLLSTVAMPLAAVVGTAEEDTAGGVRMEGGG
jgi:hypothetical protein